MMLNNHFLLAKDQSLEVVILPLVETQVKLSPTRPNIVSKAYSASQLDAKTISSFHQSCCRNMLDFFTICTKYL